MNPRTPATPARRRTLPRIARLLAGLVLAAASAGGALADAPRPAAHPGTFLVLPFRGTEVPHEMLRAYRPAGVILFAGNLRDDARALVQGLRAADPDLLIFIDQEGGPFMSYRTPTATRFPSAMALGAAADRALAFDAGHAIGAELCELGVHVNLAPVVDLNTNPDNPIIGLRSFGASSLDATPLALAFAAGLEAGGALATAKHFPGHGDTDVDSHYGLPTVKRSRDEISRVELEPFRQAVAAGVPVVMTAHILYPALDPVYPATLSRAILTDVLRAEMGFDGVIITDDMRMRAIRDHYGIDAAVTTVLAGADLVLVGQEPADAERTFRVLERALADGAITAERAAETSARVAALRDRRPAACGDASEARNVALEVARRSITWLTGPLDVRGPGTVVVAPRVSDRYGVEPSLAEVAASILPGSVGVVVSERPDAAESQRAVAAAQAAERVVLGVYHWLGRLPAEQVRLYEALVATGRPVTVVALGNPDAIRYLGSEPAGYLATYGYREVQLQAALEVLSGVTIPYGRLPVPAGVFPAGAGGMGMPIAQE